MTFLQNRINSRATGKKKQKKDSMGGYEKRFREFLKARFGSIIGDMMVKEFLRQANIEEFSKLSEPDQLEFMDEVLGIIFQKHDMKGLEKSTRTQLKLHLCLDKASEKISNHLRLHAYFENLEIERNGKTLFNNTMATAPSTPGIWCTHLKFMGNEINGKVFMFSSEKENLILLTSYARSRNMRFSPSDNFDKDLVYSEFLTSILHPYFSTISTLLKSTINFEYIKTTDANQDCIIDIKSYLEKYEANNANVQIEVIKPELKIENHEYKPILFFLREDIQKTQ